MSIEQKDTYFVAVKVFLEQDGKFLVFKDRFGCWDLPGGRIKKDEFETPLEQVLKRKISEELGDDLQYELDNKPGLIMRHQRTEAVPGTPIVRIFALGYVATLLEGKPKLSPQHTEYFWADPETFDLALYFTGGWLDGVKEYIATRRSN